ncbi:hypothetical protein FACS189434_13010 [Bacteroidia bacterium]|nr:hypothetical protein FACS189434_13010 [Bacteroidia bacterium]
MKHQNQKKWFGGIRLMLLTLLCLCASVATQAQTVQWLYGPPTADRPMIALTDDEYATITVDFMVRSAAITTPKVQITLPAGVTYVAASAAATANHTAGAITAALSGQVVTVTLASAAAETRVAFTVQVKTTANAAGCAFESGNVDVKILSNTTLVANGGQAAALAIDAVKPAFTITPKSAGKTGTTPTNGASIVAGLATPNVDKGTFNINIATTQRTAKGLRITLTVDANTTLDNFTFAGATATATKSGNVYTINLPNEVFSTTAKVLSFDGIAKYSGAHPITVGYQYTPTVNCVNGSITGVYSLNYNPIVGNAHFNMPTQTMIMPSPSTDNLPSQPNIGLYEVPMDGTTTYYYKFVYTNTGNAAAQEISLLFNMTYGSYTQYTYHDRTRQILYSINGALPKAVDRVTYADFLADNILRRVIPALKTEYNDATVYIDNDVVLPGQTLVFYVPVKSGLIYDNTLAKFSTAFQTCCDVFPGINSINGGFNAKNGNGEAVSKQSLSSSGPNSIWMFRFTAGMSAQYLAPGEKTSSASTVATPTLNNSAALYKPQTQDINIKIPPFIELTNAATGAVTTDITQSVVYKQTSNWNYNQYAETVITPLTVVGSSTDAQGYTTYTLRYAPAAAGQLHGDFSFSYKAIDATNPKIASYTENTTDSIELWVDLNLGAQTAAAAAYRPTLPRLTQYFIPVTLAIEEEGLRLLSFNLQRTRKGFVDANNNRIADSNAPAPDAAIENDKYWNWDTGNMVVKGAIKATAGNTIYNNLYILLNSEISLAGGTWVTVKPATLTIKRNGTEINKVVNVSTTTTAGKRYFLAENAALIANDSITLTIPFETNDSETNRLQLIRVDGYVDTESTLRPTDPYNPDATAGYTKYGKDYKQTEFGIYNSNLSMYHGQNYTLANNNYTTIDALAFRFSPDIYNNFLYEASHSYAPITATIVIPDGYKLAPAGTGYGEGLNVYWGNGTYGGERKTIPYVTKGINAAGLEVYTYDLSSIFDANINEANPGDGTKWSLPDENFHIHCYVTAKATKGAPPSSNFNGTVLGTLLLRSGQPTTATALNTPVNYTGEQISLAVPTNTVNAYGKTITVPTVTPGNPNTVAHNMWLYVAGNVSNVKAQKLGSMDFPINGTGTDGKWIPVGNIAAQAGVDYSLSFDYTDMTNCAGDTIIVYTVYDNGNATYNPVTTPFANIPENNLGQFKRIFIKPAPASILSTLSVTPSSLTYNTAYTLSATVDASSSQGILKNDTLIITIPSGQEYVPNSAKVEYPAGTVVSVAPSVEAALVAHNSNIQTQKEFKFSTAEALGQPAFAFDGIASGNPAANQRSIFTAQFKPMCETQLTGIRYLVEPRGYSACGQVATGSGRNFRSQVMISNITTGYEYAVSPATVSGNRAFNEISKTESLKITIRKTAGTGIAEPATDSLVVTMPSALNVSGSITLVSADLGVNTTVGAANYRNTVSGNLRTIAVQLPAATVAAAAPLNKNIDFTMTVNYTPNGQTFALNPEQTIDAIVQTNVKFNAACPNAPAAVGNGSLGVAFITAAANPDFFCLNMSDTLKITSDGFQGLWYKEKAKTTLLPSLESGVKFAYKPTVQLDTAFYISAIVSGTDYGVVPVQVKMNAELKPAATSRSAVATQINGACDGFNTVFTNNSTLGGAAAPASVTYEWYDVTSGKTPFAGAAFTAKNPSVAFPVGKHKVLLQATSADGCFAVSDTIRFEVFPLPVPTISGTSPACYNSSEVYTTEPGMSNYTWTMSKSNGTDFDGNLSPSTTNTATVSWETPNVVGIISVNYTDLNGCRATAPTDYNVIVRNLPPTPQLSSGATEVCANSEEMYVVQKITGIKSYNWSLSPASLGTFTNDGDANDKTATILWGETPGNAVITINHVNNDNCEAEITLTVPVKVKGSARPTINGSATACANGTLRYETAAGMSAYNFTVTGGTYTGVTGSPNAIDVTWGAAGTGTISVSYISDGCPTAMTTPFSVTINARPTLSWLGTPKTSVCVGEVVTYSAPAGKTNYVWTVVGSSSSTGGSTTDNTITVTWDDVTSGSVSVNYEDGGCPAVNPLKVSISVSKVVMKATTGASVVCVGSDVTLTNSTAGTKTWHSDNAAIATVDNTGKVSGVTAGSTSIWCIVSNAAGCKDSIDHSITVQTATAITTQPTATPSALCPSETVVLTVVAAGQAPLTYQWTKNGSNISGAQGASYTADAAGTYAVIVSGGCGAAVTSNNVSITAKKATTISVQPQNAAICPGVSATLSVTAEGEGTLTYLWKKDGVNAPGTNNAATYSANAAGDYTVEVKGDCGAAVTSSVAKVSAKLPTVINTQPVGGEICSGSTLKLEVVATGEGTLHYQWKLNGTTNVGGDAASYQAGAAGSYTVEISGGCGAAVVSDAVSVAVKAATAISTQPALSSAICPGDNVILSVVATGASPVTYQWTKNGTNILGAQGTSYTADAAGTYKVIVSGACGSPLESDNAVVTLKKATVINIQPQATSAICSGESATLSVSADGEGVLTYQWKKDGTNAPGASTAATYSATDAGNYTVEVTGGCGNAVLSNAASVTVKAATVINNHPQSAAICSGSSQTLTVTATGEGTLNFQCSLLSVRCLSIRRCVPFRQD